MSLINNKVEESFTLKNFILNVINEEIKKYLNENISIKNNLDNIEILFLKNNLDINKNEIKEILKLLKKYIGVDDIKKTKNGMVINFKDENTLSTTNFISFVTEIKNKLGLNIKRENKNTYIIGLE